MSIIKNYLEDHIIENEMVKENQGGFTKAERIHDDMFKLQEQATERKKNQAWSQLTLLWHMILSYAIESLYLNQDTLIEILKDCRIQGEIIDFILRIYNGDKTKIDLGD